MTEAVAQAVWFSCLLPSVWLEITAGAPLSSPRRSPSKDLLTRSGITGAFRLLSFDSLLSFAKLVLRPALSHAGKDQGIRWQ